MKAKVVFSALFLSVGLTAFQQEPAGSPGVTGTIHFYRLNQSHDASQRPPLVCDGVRLGRLENGTFLDLKVLPGRHTFYVDDKQDGAAVMVEAGKDYYFKADPLGGLLKSRYRVSMVTPEQGRSDISKLKALDAPELVHQLPVPAAK